MTTIATSAQPAPITSPNVIGQFVNSGGMLTNHARLALQQQRDYVVNMNRSAACNAVTSGGFVTLTLLDVQPAIKQYASHDRFTFVADATVTSATSAVVVTNSGTLSTLNVYSSNGAKAVSSGGIVSGLQYELTYVDALNGGAGGFVLR